MIIDDAWFMLPLFMSGIMVSSAIAKNVEIHKLFHGVRLDR